MITHIEIKSGTDLSLEEEKEINIAKNREWGLPPMDQKHKDNHVFALLKNSEHNILAQAQLLTLNGVIFNNELFDIYGIGGVIVNSKNKGYGKELMRGILAYLKKSNKSAIGFTNFDVIEFYV
ncbi:MAG: hypothetical protein WCO06_07445, partial [Candidatus Roizmanbacteria bacterium]